jgi:cell fate (sporulation/competence/biofilm development) regulator YlbF (YheA/YmcA/DUF963 family)
VTEDVNLPADLKRNLSQLKELDTQAQELFERMQRLSKNHITRAKRSVQDGREPDEEYLTKARKCYRELMELDEEKVQLADQVRPGLRLLLRVSALTTSRNALTSMNLTRPVDAL